MTVDEVKEKYKINLAKQIEIRSELDIELQKQPPTEIGTRSKLVYSEPELRKVLIRFGYRKITADDVGKYSLDGYIR